MIRSYVLRATPSTGGAGTSGVTSDPRTISGRVIAVGLKYLDSPPAGSTDVTVEMLANTDVAPARTVLAVTNAATDGWFFPTAAMTGGAAGDLQGGIPVDGQVTVAIAQANDGDGVIATLIVDE